MKKIYILLLFLIAGLSINANPIATPMLDISELFFDDFNNWKLEISYYWVDQSSIPIDSIYLISSTDTVKLTNYSFTGTNGLFVLTEDSLDSSFSISRYGDSLKILYFFWGFSEEDLLIFGNMPGAIINYPRQGQSISRYSFYLPPDPFFVKDNSPTLGFENDTNDTKGTLSGVIYNLSLQPILNRQFAIYDYNDVFFQTSGTGSYSISVFAKPNSFVTIKSAEPPYSYYNIPIAPAAYEMEPDSVINLDIFLLGGLVSIDNNREEDNSPVKIYPNPASAKDQINIEIDLPVMTSNIWIEIFDAEGKLIGKEKTNQQFNSISAPEESGVYMIRILLDSEVISNKRIVIND